MKTQKLYLRSCSIDFYHDLSLTNINILLTQVLLIIIILLYYKINVGRSLGISYEINKFSHGKYQVVSYLYLLIVSIRLLLFTIVVSLIDIILELSNINNFTMNLFL